MANNRMYIVNKASGQKYLLSKYFTEWDNRVNSYDKDFGEWLKQNSIQSQSGNTDFFLEFETSQND